MTSLALFVAFLGCNTPERAPPAEQQTGKGTASGTKADLAAAQDEATAPQACKKNAECGFGVQMTGCKSDCKMYATSNAAYKKFLEVYAKACEGQMDWTSCGGTNADSVCKEGVCTLYTPEPDQPGDSSVDGPDFSESWFKAGTNLYEIVQPTAAYFDTCTLGDDLNLESGLDIAYFSQFKLAIFGSSYVNCDFKTGFLASADIVDNDPKEGALFFSSTIKASAPAACTIASDVKLEGYESEGGGELVKMKNIETPLPGCSKTEYFVRQSDIWRR